MSAADAVQSAVSADEDTESVSAADAVQSAVPADAEAESVSAADAVSDSDTVSRSAVPDSAMRDRAGRLVAPVLL